jgi:hypothetical protein
VVYGFFGTSHSTPATAGVVAPPVSISSTAAPHPRGDEQGFDADLLAHECNKNDSLPSNNQGMVKSAFNNYFDIFATAHLP